MTDYEEKYFNLLEHLESLAQVMKERDMVDNSLRKVIYDIQRLIDEEVSK